MAKRIQELLREEDLLSRQGGDEFVVVLPSVTNEGTINVVNKLVKSIFQSFLIEGNELASAASIGIAM